MDFTIEFQKFIEDRLEEIIEEITEKDADYARYRTYLKENHEKAKGIIFNLPKEDMIFMNEYEANLVLKNSIEQSEFYYRGYKDCIKILKWLGMI